tara:strand:+ start:472 stop:678 length:207 start_codon:yes stop_codon:yes gene_type:complete
MIYRGYDIEETIPGYTITLEMPSGDKRHIATVDTLEIAQETVDEEKRIMSILEKLKKERIEKQKKEKK